MDINYSTIGPEVLDRIDMSTIADKIAEFADQTLASQRYLNENEIRDYTFELIDLFSSILKKGEISGSDPAYQTLGRLMMEVHGKIQMRGGSAEAFFRLIQFIQNLFLESLLAQVEPSEEVRQMLLYLIRFFNKLVMDTFRLYQLERKMAVEAQQNELMAVATPITEIWDGVLSLPVIGTLDSSRAMDLMEKLLQRIEEVRARVIILDLTGVSTIDTQVMHHLIQVIRASGLMGARAILTGIRPCIARSLANLNINMGDIQTKSTLSEGLKEAFRSLGFQVSRTQAD
ncbi:rsbT co-antagonist protein RsbR [Desulfobotulus alkaliphilus]|uniref:RsbT co-antagonist protein RsbR n=1 Tax=Desulfobotulus alkaliphilus TaxID=622671 RepID=A0A562S7R5_9BACT|nr:STAS domain-containing protein [Desulfobotulus alkaliphilus]TWI77328.1 rsbT co-antagonist protein RsbR [Desulfobotulus alkaliphilus]